MFPNNAPGPSSLSPPTSEAELRALRRRAASALWSLVPSAAAGRVYLAARSDADAIDQVDESLLVLGDVYCNKHLLYATLELLFVRLMPELSEKGVAELWEERLA
ncbi:hypothetical protein XA68_12147 [Ophiocordyceps unilateralis]|uniref:Uncharacterized protein n=1 Tax=Ophiocordyceps unilateralis TaxID=268505 RepID=A0A2A9NWN7_OPHUN|nr:hypothetical protein XA68_12147 [Ophiocordyceps unilateralis]